MRLIDADALDEALTALRFTVDGELAHWGDRKDWCLHGSEIEMLIANAPTINPKPARYGHWIECQGGLKCSECGHYPLSRIILRGEKIWEVDVNEDLLYCPYCGSKMGEGR